jgi:hypothetical protein
MSAKQSADEGTPAFPEAAREVRDLAQAARAVNLLAAT